MNNDIVPGFDKLRQMSSRGGELSLQGMQPRVYEVLGLLGFAHHFTVTEDLTESLARFDCHSENSLFPNVFPCPTCGKRLCASKPGRFRCRECKAILVIGETSGVMAV